VGNPLRLKIEKLKRLADEILNEYIELCEPQTPLETLDLSNRVLNCLERRDINSVEQLMKLSEREVMRIRGIGKLAYGELMKKVVLQCG